jgi:hypothetical protein
MSREHCRVTVQAEAETEETGSWFGGREQPVDPVRRPGEHLVIRPERAYNGSRSRGKRGG